MAPEEQWNAKNNANFHTLVLLGLVSTWDLLLSSLLHNRCGDIVRTEDFLEAEGTRARQVSPQN
jgi:hypothetical protein